MQKYDWADADNLGSVSLLCIAVLLLLGEILHNKLGIHAILWFGWQVIILGRGSIMIAIGVCIVLPNVVFAPITFHDMNSVKLVILTSFFFFWVMDWEGYYHLLWWVGAIRTTATSDSGMIQFPILVLWNKYLVLPGGIGRLLCQERNDHDADKCHDCEETYRR